MCHMRIHAAFGALGICVKCHMRRTIHVSYEEEDAFVIQGYMRLSEHLVCVPTVPLSAHKKGGGWRDTNHRHVLEFARL